MRCMINHARRAAGVAPLRSRGTHLGRAADRKAADILVLRLLPHRLRQPRSRCGWPRSGYAGGCFARGREHRLGLRPARLRPRRRWRAGSRRRGHRANLLSPRFADHGIALRTGALAGEDNAAVWVHQLGHAC